ncbi:MAG: T9SS type A sorting domain-containing protein [Bacteroidetes bacterium]|nr:T9SS type A sorting domain-containing protein [Bacteroidota bacterium]
MKNIIILCFTLLLNHLSGQSYTWAVTDNTMQCKGVAIEKNADGSLVVAQTFTQTGTRGISIIKYDVNHNIVWVQKIIGNNFLTYRGFDLKTDKLGNIFFTGSFMDTIKINGLFLYNAGASSAMIMIKYNTQGHYQWSKRTFGNGVAALKLSSDLNNNIYVIGYLTGNNNFDSTNINITASGGICNYIAKYSNNGILKWVKRTNTGNSSFWGLGLETDSAGNSYVGGSFISREVFGTYTLNAYGGANFEEAYLAKIDSSGNWLWATHIGGGPGGGDASGLYDLALDAAGQPYICGFTSYPTTSFDAISLNTTGEDDWFLAKYDVNGKCMWAKSGGGPGSQFATGVCVDNQNHIYLARTGTFFSKFDGNGNYLLSDYKQGVANIAMASDAAGNIYFTGQHNTTVNFDGSTLNFVGGNQNQMFIAEYNNGYMPTFIKKDIKEDLFTIYPNPTTQNITISSNLPFHVYNLKITNAIGQIVYTVQLQNAKASNHEINIGHFAKGLYLVELVDESKKTAIQTKKLIVN